MLAIAAAALVGGYALLSYRSVAKSRGRDRVIFAAIDDHLSSKKRKRFRPAAFDFDRAHGPVPAFNNSFRIVEYINVSC